MKILAGFLFLMFFSVTTFAESGGKDLIVNFDNSTVDKIPEGFSVALTGRGGPVIWAVKEDSTAPSSNRVLAQLSSERDHVHFPLCVYDGFKVKDVLVSVKFKPVSGRIDQAGGIVVRYHDQDNYYVVRANALEGNIDLYKIVGGVRQEITGGSGQFFSGQWQTLGLEIQGAHLKVFFADKLLFEADDNTFQNEGKVGLWTKADSVTYFDDLRIKDISIGK